MRAKEKDGKYYIDGCGEPICLEAAAWINEQPEEYNPQQLWDICPDSEWMLWILYNVFDVTDSLYREMAYSFTVRTLEYVEDKELICETLEVVSRYIDGEATVEELRAAYWAAYWTADRAADSAADMAASWAAYWTAERAADRAAYWAVDRAADMAAYWTADRVAEKAAYWAADSAAERKIQAEIIRIHIPKLEVV